jgi:hypothetical protein
METALNNSFPCRYCGIDYCIDHSYQWYHITDERKANE